MSEMNNKYFEWLCSLVSGRGYYKKHSYCKLLAKLHTMKFTYVIGMDANRADDGVELRYRFGYENDVSYAEIDALLDDRPCSVLEMMVALAIRCEEQIMDDPDIGNRTGKWFWSMIANMGLYQMDDLRFDSENVEQNIRIMLERRYDRNGNGGLFFVNRSKKDMRKMEIWYQMMWYLDDILQN